MRFIYIQFRIKGMGSGRNLNGQCRIRALPIKGSSPEEVERAELLRKQILQARATVLFEHYSSMTTNMLNVYLLFYQVTCLKELIEAQVSEDLFYLLSLYLADEVIREAKRQMQLFNLKNR